jgi:hypothetical protein
MEEGWAAYGNCPECGGKLIKKKNRTGAMATVKHEVANAKCNFKFGSVHDGGKKGTERTEEKNGDKKGAAATASSGENSSSGGNSGGSSGAGENSNAGGNDDGKNKSSASSEPAKRESYSERLKRLYS